MYKSLNNTEILKTCTTVSLETEHLLPSAVTPKTLLLAVNMLRNEIVVITDLNCCFLKDSVLTQD
jgi:hypothetical protein